KNFFVDIFVGDIDPADKADVAVDNRYLPVIAVINRHRKARPEGVVVNNFNSLAENAFFKVITQAFQAAKVIVNYPDVDAFFYFPRENLKDAIPHLALGNNKILHEDKLLRLNELLQQGGVKCLAAFKKAR